MFFQQKMSPFWFISLSFFFSLSFKGLSPIFSFSLSYVFLYIPRHYILSLYSTVTATTVMKNCVMFQKWIALHETIINYTCQLFLRYEREIFILGVLGFLEITRSFPKIPEEVRSLPKTSEVCRRQSYRENAYPQNQRS